MLNDVQTNLAKIAIATQQLVGSSEGRTCHPERPHVTPIQVDDEVLGATTPQGVHTPTQTPKMAYPQTPGASSAGCPTPVGTPRAREPGDAETQEAPEAKRACVAQQAASSRDIPPCS